MLGFAFHALRPFDAAFRSIRRGPVNPCACALALFFIAPGFVAMAQDTTTTPDTQKSSPLPRVTTTVVVHGGAKNDYFPQSATVGTLDGLPLQQIPASVLVVTRAQIADQGARVLSDVVKNDASIGEDYAPVGYYGVFEIRGFPIDLATALQINGLTIAGEQDVPFENKESVEFFKGIAGVESGVASAGGLINYTTKRPALIYAIDMATDHRGTAYGATDLGHLFGSRKQVGARINLAGEDIRSYVNHTDGWRGVGAGSADWHISPVAILKGDYEYQHKLQPSVCGYQLLGGTTVPDLSRIHPSTLLGDQSWTKPNTFDTQNSSARFDYELPHAWKTFAAASYSHSLIDDNVIYPYGSQEGFCGVNSPSYFFGQDGDYDIYDYRNPGELRINAQAEALIMGSVKTGSLMHDLAFGGVLFRRSVQQPEHSVNVQIGSENIYQPLTAFPIETDPDTGKPDQAGPRVLDEDDHQSAAILQDRIHLPGHIQLLVSGRENSLRDHNPKATGMVDGTLTDGVNTDKTVWLPQYAVTWNPLNALTLYGNYSVMLSLGQQAPWFVDNSSVYLAPYFTRQVEVGAKFQPTPKLLTSATFYHMRAPFFYTRTLQAPDSFCSYNYDYDTDFAPGDLCFESQGHETHNGVELNAQGKAAKWMQLSASLHAISAQSSDTGTSDYDGKQVINTPRVRTALFGDILIPHAHNLHLLPGWSYTSRKEATHDDSVSVSGYGLVNLGARYTPGGEDSHLTMRIYADNILDKRYWKDTGASYGDTFIHLGAPTTVRLSAHYTF